MPRAWWSQRLIPKTFINVCAAVLYDECGPRKEHGRWCVVRRRSFPGVFAGLLKFVPRVLLGLAEESSMRYDAVT
uniref:Putative secreted protein n=1 Tax=Anopheles darlingi TaxID=43151 RepID=A0A2M4DFR5_ANODA